MKALGMSSDASGDETPAAPAAKKKSKKKPAAPTAVSAFAMLGADSDDDASDKVRSHMNYCSC